MGGGLTNGTLLVMRIKGTGVVLHPLHGCSPEQWPLAPQLCSELHQDPIQVIRAILLFPAQPGGSTAAQEKTQKGASQRLEPSDHRVMAYPCQMVSLY